MKKTLSILFAVIIAMSALVSAGAIGLVNENNLQSNIASYMGYDESKMQDFKAEKITRNALDYYEVTFKYDGVGYHVGFLRCVQPTSRPQNSMANWHTSQSLRRN